MGEVRPATQIGRGQSQSLAPLPPSLHPPADLGAGGEQRILFSRRQLFLMWGTVAGNGGFYARHLMSTILRLGGGQGLGQQEPPLQAEGEEAKGPHLAAEKHGSRGEKKWGEQHAGPPRRRGF